MKHRQHHRRGPAEVTQLRLTIAGWYRLGLKYQEIAVLTEVSIHYVAQIVHQLFRQGQLIPRNHYPKRQLTDQFQRLTPEVKDRIIELHRQGLPYAEIARQIGRSKPSVNSAIHHLQVKGVLPNRPRGARPLFDERLQRMIEMRQAGATYAGIGRSFGISHQAVHRQLKKATARFGPEVCQPPSQLLTLRKAAVMLQVPLPRLKQALRDLAISTVAWGGRKRLLTVAVVEDLRNHPSLRRYCRFCAALLTIERRHGASRQYCSRQCSSRAQRLRHVHEIHLNPRYQLLNQRLRRQHIPPDEQWVGMKEAVRRSGLTSMQLTYLRLIGVLTVHTEQTHGAIRPLKYRLARSQLDVVREVFATGPNAPSQVR